MATPTQRYVRNRTDGEVFVAGYGVVPGNFEGDLEDSDAVKALVGANVFADVKRPDEPTKTGKQLAAEEATERGIEFDYDSVTEKQLRDMVAQHDKEKEASA